MRLWRKGSALVHRKDLGTRKGPTIPLPPPIKNARLFSRRTAESTEQALRKSGLQKTGLFPRALYVTGVVTHFRKGRSTELLQLHMTEKLRFALNQKKSVGVIFIDFQKAFDCAFHQLLPIKLPTSDLCLYERLQPDVRARIIGCKT